MISGEDCNIRRTSMSGTHEHLRSTQKPQVPDRSDSGCIACQVFGNLGVADKIKQATRGAIQARLGTSLVVFALRPDLLARKSPALTLGPVANRTQAFFRNQGTPCTFPGRDEESWAGTAACDGSGGGMRPL